MQASHPRHLHLFITRTNKFENSAVDEEDPSDADELDVDLVAKISGLLDGCHADSLDRLTPEQK